MTKESSRIVKTYMSFGLPIDPANIRTLVDLDLSYALGSTLVDWNAAREPVAALAESWDIVSDEEAVFKLRTNAKWSDGSPITADQVVRSFLRAKEKYVELRSLFDIIESIKVKDSRSISFHLNQPVAKSSLVRKLTEPMYGVAFINADGSIDLHKTAGPFSVKSATPQEIRLIANPHSYLYDKKMPTEVVIRQPIPAHDTEDGAVFDNWANLAGSASIMEEAINKKYGEGRFSIWHRNLDKVMFLSPGPKNFSADGRKLIQALGATLDRKAVTKGLGGLHLSDQFFPAGYSLYNPEFKKTNSAVEIPTEFKKRSMTILVTEGRLGNALQKNLQVAVTQATGHAPTFKVVPLSEIEKARTLMDYDILAASLPVNDPNVDGSMAYFSDLRRRYFQMSMKVRAISLSESPKPDTCLTKSKETLSTET